jgi:hypothetical protein
LRLEEIKDILHKNNYVYCDRIGAEYSINKIKDTKEKWTDYYYDDDHRFDPIIKKYRFNSDHLIMDNVHPRNFYKMESVVTSDSALGYNIELTKFENLLEEMKSTFPFRRTFVVTARETGTIRAFFPDDIELEAIYVPSNRYPEKIRRYYQVKFQTLYPGCSISCNNVKGSNTAFGIYNINKRDNLLPLKEFLKQLRTNVLVSEKLFIRNDYFPG